MATKRPSAGGASSRRKIRAVAPSAEEMLNAISRSGQFGPRQLSGLGKITGPDFKGLPTAASYGEFDEIIPLFGQKDTMQYYERDKDKTLYNNLANEPIPVDDEYEETAPAPLTLVPTTTINPKRPRTVAAGYDKYEEKITVVFRDGTFYNYYEVDPNEWQHFKAVISKGRYIYQYLDSKPRGEADISQLSQTSRKAFYRFARGAQLHYERKRRENFKRKK